MIRQNNQERVSLEGVKLKLRGALRLLFTKVLVLVLLTVSTLISIEGVLGVDSVWASEGEEEDYTVETVKQEEEEHYRLVKAQFPEKFDLEKRLKILEIDITHNRLVMEYDDKKTGEEIRGLNILWVRRGQESDATIDGANPYWGESLINRYHEEFAEMFRGKKKVDLEQLKILFQPYEMPVPNFINNPSDSLMYAYSLWTKDGKSLGWKNGRVDYSRCMRVYKPGLICKRREIKGKVSYEPYLNGKKLVIPKTEAEILAGQLAKNKIEIEKIKEKGRLEIEELKERLKAETIKFKELSGGLKNQTLKVVGMSEVKTKLGSLDTKISKQEKEIVGLKKGIEEQNKQRVEEKKKIEEGKDNNQKLEIPLTSNPKFDGEKKEELNWLWWVLGISASLGIGLISWFKLVSRNK